MLEVEARVQQSFEETGNGTDLAIEVLGGGWIVQGGLCELEGACCCELD